MAVQTINIGNAANDGTGDDLREAFIKVNNNFADLEAVQATDGLSLGNTGSSVYKDKVANSLRFRNLIGGSNINLTQLDNTIVIDGSDPVQQSAVISDVGSILLGNGSSWAIYGGDGVETRADANASPNPQIIIDAALEQDTSPTLGASLDANSQNITGVNNLSSTSALTATLTVNGTGSISTLAPTNIRTTSTNSVPYEANLGRFLTWDIGSITATYEGQLQWLLGNQIVDLGTITSPASGGIDGGSI